LQVTPIGAEGEIQALGDPLLRSQGFDVSEMKGLVFAGIFGGGLQPAGGLKQHLLELGSAFLGGSLPACARENQAGSGQGVFGQSIDPVQISKALANGFAEIRKIQNNDGFIGGRLEMFRNGLCLLFPQAGQPKRDRRFPPVLTIDAVATTADFEIYMRPAGDLSVGEQGGPELRVRERKARKGPGVEW
jgi:hypothetical protein